MEFKLDFSRIMYTYFEILIYITIFVLFGSYIYVCKRREYKFKKIYFTV